MQRLLQGARILEQDPHGIKVAQLPSGTILKLFRRKRLLSSAAWRPYALRFVDNARLLQQRAIPTVQIRSYLHCPQRARHVVAYRPLPGQVLRDRLAQGEAIDWRRVAAFVAGLHDSGVYFRSLHSGNVVCVHGGGFGLIDIADMRVFAKPLGLGRRVRNLRPLLRDPQMAPLREREVFGTFLEAYVEATQWHGLGASRLQALAWRRWSRFSRPRPAAGPGPVRPEASDSHR
ncbi:MAG TPA: hypothetical protein DIT63_11780 [Gammaproteobacteria bacterium]|nr:hypothetical protein [Gammaproteobacteria bacterium]